LTTTEDLLPARIWRAGSLLCLIEKKKSGAQAARMSQMQKILKKVDINNNKL
jgi:hypothetical protein